MYTEFRRIYPNTSCSLSTFVRHKPYNVKIGRLPTKANLLGDCPHCEILTDLEKKVSQGQQLTREEQAQLKQKQMHRESHKAQTSFYLQMKETAKADPSLVLLIHDFAKIYKGNRRYNDLMVSVFIWDTEKKELSLALFGLYGRG